jgi:hypothetical protein
VAQGGVSRVGPQGWSPRRGPQECFPRGVHEGDHPVGSLEWVHRGVNQWVILGGVPRVGHQGLSPTGIPEEAPGGCDLLCPKGCPAGVHRGFPRGSPSVVVPIRGPPRGFSRVVPICCPQGFPTDWVPRWGPLVFRGRVPRGGNPEGSPGWSNRY